ncbi:MAG: VCBS repeat-containing protein, partial [Verrucomicrobiota bacterium]
GYPQPLPITGRPLAVVAGDLDGKGQTSVVVLTEDKGTRAISILQRQRDGTAKVIRSFEIPGFKTDPHGLKLVDANQDGRLDLAVFTPLDTMRLFVQSDDGKFSDASADPAFRKSLVDDLEAGAVTVGDIDGDGKPELLVNTGALTRALRLDAKGALTVVDQFSARDTTAEIAAAFVLPAATKGALPEVLLYDRKSEQFQRLRAGKDKVYEVAEITPAGKIDAVGAEVRLPTRGGAAELFLLGKNRFWWLPSGRGDLAVHTMETYTTDLPAVDYGDVTAGDLTGDGEPELVAVDPEENMIEILACDPATKAWVSRLHFKVFESDQHYQGKKGSPQQPRETVIADVTGDGRNDLILLVHDRILVYPQR